MTIEDLGTFSAFFAAGALIGSIALPAVLLASWLHAHSR